MLITNNRLIAMPSIVLILILTLFIGCAGIPCSPPEYYAPEEGSPYIAEEVRVSTQAGHVLVGTLTVPKDVNQPLPGVVLITGSSPQNRDHSPVYCPEYRFFRQIADALSQQGIVVLRMDDRGCGCSGGGSLESATTPERADDIRAGILLLKNREEVDSNRIGLIGLSEGAIIAPMIAVTDSSIIAIVLMAGPASNFDVILDFQDGTAWRGMSDSLSGWHQFLLKYDPLPTAERVRCPVLILHGDQDEKVPVEDANRLAGAIRRGGNKDVTVKIFPGYNHGFINLAEANKKDEAGKPLSEILKISPDVINVISDWIVDRLRGGN
jgi:dipeptidyl aminopeptidase/acylaminoacyl peptidase